MALYSCDWIVWGCLFLLSTHQWLWYNKSTDCGLCTFLRPGIFLICLYLQVTVFCCFLTHSYCKVWLLSELVGHLWQCHVSWGSYILLWKSAYSEQQTVHDNHGSECFSLQWLFHDIHPHFLQHLMLTSILWTSSLIKKNHTNVFCLFWATCLIILLQFYHAHVVWIQFISIHFLPLCFNEVTGL